MNPTPVVVTDIQMRFTSMIVFMLKWALASIPAAIVIVGVLMFLWTFFAAFLLAFGK